MLFDVAEMRHDVRVLTYPLLQVHAAVIDNTIKWRKQCANNILSCRQLSWNKFSLYNRPSFCWSHFTFCNLLKLALPSQIGNQWSTGAQQPGNAFTGTQFVLGWKIQNQRILPQIFTAYGRAVYATVQIHVRGITVPNVRIRRDALKKIRGLLRKLGDPFQLYRDVWVSLASRHFKQSPDSAEWYRDVGVSLASRHSKQSPDSAERWRENDDSRFIAEAEPHLLIMLGKKWRTLSLDHSATWLHRYWRNNPGIWLWHGIESKGHENPTKLFCYLLIKCS